MDIHASVSGKFTIRNERRDFPEWHRGRPIYLLWALTIDTPLLAQRMHAAKQHLDGLLLDDYCRQAHITLNLCGFPSSQPRYADDFSAESFHTQLAALRQLALGPFEIEIGGLDSFSSAPYLSVGDTNGNITALHNCLAVGEIDLPDWQFTPHVTVGLYADAWPISDVDARLCSFNAGDPLTLKIAGISLMSYAAKEIGGQLTHIADYDFENCLAIKNWTLPFSLEPDQ